MAGPIRLEREREIYAREKIRSPTYAQQEAEDEYKRRVDREIARSKKGDSAFGLRSQHGDWRGRAEQRMTSIELRALQGQKRAAHMRWAQPPATHSGYTRFDAIDERLRRFGAAGLTTAGQYGAASWDDVIHLEAAAGVASDLEAMHERNAELRRQIIENKERERDERARRRRSDEERAMYAVQQRALARVREEGRRRLEMERERAEEEERMLEARARRIERKALRDSGLAQSAFHSTRLQAREREQWEVDAARRRLADEAATMRAQQRRQEEQAAARLARVEAELARKAAARRETEEAARREAELGSIHSAAARRRDEAAAARRREAISRSQRQAEEDLRMAREAERRAKAMEEVLRREAEEEQRQRLQELEEQRMAQEEYKEAHTAARAAAASAAASVAKPTFAAVGVDGGGYSYASAAPPKEKGARFAAMEEAGTHSEQQLLEAAFDAMLDPEWEGEADPPADVLKVVHEDSD